MELQLEYLFEHNFIVRWSPKNMQVEYNNDREHYVYTSESCVKPRGHSSTFCFKICVVPNLNQDRTLLRLTMKIKESGK